jgi:hypothetical protein
MADSDLKQACLDLSGAACELFDGLDEHGDEAPWEDARYLHALMRIATAHGELASHFKAMAARRLMHLGAALPGERA